MNQNNMTSEMKVEDEVLILYVKEFKAKADALELNGHLQEGGIYLCLKHKEDKPPNRTMYRIFFDDGKQSQLDGIFLQSLEENNDSWYANLEVLDMTKIDDYNLTDSEINYAIDIKNMSLDEVKAKMDENTPDSEKGKTVFERIDEGPQVEEELDVDIIEKIYEEALGLTEKEEIESKNNLKDVLDDVIEYVGTTFDDKYADSMINTMDMLNSKHGKYISVFNAVKYLARYSTDGYEKSENPQDLMKAIHYLLIEMNRVKTNLK